MENIKKVHISIDMEPCEDGKTHTKAHIEGNTDDLLIAFTELSKRFLATLEEHHGTDFVEAAYAITQSIILKESCMKERYEAHEKTFERIQPLMSILGKTFTMPEKKDGEEE